MFKGVILIDTFFFYLTSLLWWLSSETNLEKKNKFEFSRYSNFIRAIFKQISVTYMNDINVFFFIFLYDVNTETFTH